MPSPEPKDSSKGSTFVLSASPNGPMQFQGTWLLKDTSNTNLRYLGNTGNDRAIGSAFFYYKNGSLEKQIDYLPLGAPCDITTNYKTAHTTYYKSSVMGSTWQEERGKEHGTIKMYDEETGTVAVTMEMVHGKAHGDRVQFYTDDTIYSITPYVNGKKHGFYTEFYTYPFKVKYREEYNHGQLISRESF
jgi:antitoxin component YwqK of YwqJK toxin-antitoxin module